MADSCSLTKRLSVSMCTETAALTRMCAHKVARKPTQARKYVAAHGRPRRRARYRRTHMRTHAHTIHISFISVPCAFCWAEANPVFPPLTASAGCAYYLCAHTTPAGASSPLNMETPARCKFWMRPREQKVQEIKARAVDVYSFGGNDCHFLCFKLAPWKNSSFVTLLFPPRAFHFAILFKGVQKQGDSRCASECSFHHNSFTFNFKIILGLLAIAYKRVSLKVCSPATVANPRRNRTRWSWCCLRPQTGGHKCNQDVAQNVFLFWIQRF